MLSNRELLYCLVKTASFFESRMTKFSYVISSCMIVEVLKKEESIANIANS